MGDLTTVADVRSGEHTAPAPPTPSGRSWRDLLRPSDPTQRADIRRTLVVTGVVAAALAIAYLLLPSGGTDLSAQTERAAFAAHHGLHPVDFSWYGGTDQFGYSLVSQFVMAVLGVRLTGALAAVGTSLAFAVLLARSGARRPELGGVVGAACITANLASGRVTYALGLAFAVGALAALTGVDKRRALGAAAVGAVLASATSPVAGLFLGLAGVALILTGRRAAGLTLGIAAVVPIAVVSGIFGQGGWMNISAQDTRHGVLLSLAAALLVPRKAVRVGAILSAVGVLAAYHVHTPVGLNALRLSVMFAIPLIVAFLRWRLPFVAVIVGLLWWYQPPVNIGDVRDAGTVTAHRAYYRPLLAELERLHPTARVEVPPTRDYWESVYLAERTPIARGWLRQIDLDRNLIFFDGSITAVSYHRWLRNNGVRYIAVPDAALSWVGAGEAKIVAAGQPWLRRVWNGGHWRLYAVGDSRGIAGTPGVVTAADSTGVTVRVRKVGALRVKVRFSRWLTLDHGGACLRPAGRWSELQVSEPGTYRIGSSLHLHQAARCD